MKPWTGYISSQLKTYKLTYAGNLSKKMKSITVILLLLSFTVAFSCHTSKKFGLYTGSGYTSGYSFTLMQNSTFEYRLRGHMISDTSAGNYSIKGDTVYFNYIYRPHSSENLPPPAPARPTFALWKNYRLYPFYSTEDQINKKHVLKYSK